MKILHGMLEEVLGGLSTQALVELIAEKLAAQGVQLSERERKQLAAHLEQGDAETFVFRRWKWWKHQHVKLEFTPEDLEAAEHRFTDFVENRLADVIQAATDDVSLMILEGLKGRWRSERRQQRREVSGFRKRLHDHWKRPLDELRMLLTIVRESGEIFGSELAESPEAPTRAHLIEVLSRLHARACQIAEEVICLLEGGFADGAMARWRTLHEVAVVAFFVAEHGEDVAERYLLHDAVESMHGLTEYKRWQPALGFEPVPESEARAVQDAFDKVVARFGREFAGHYGWAAHHLRISNPQCKEFTFPEIERVMGIGHLRPHYRMASHNVHAKPKGVFVKLGLLSESDLLLAGPSNVGLDEPGQCTALSLAHVCTAHGSAVEPTLDTVVLMKIVSLLASEIAEAFVETGRRLADRDP